MAQGNQDAVNGQGAEIRGKQEADRFAEMTGGGGIAHHYQQQHQQCRHQDGRSTLKATLQATGYHQDNQRHKDGVPEQQQAGVTQQITEQGAYRVSRTTGEVTHGRVADVGSRPAADDGVERQNDKGREHTDDGRNTPTRRRQVALCHQPETGDRVVATIPADKHLGHHDGNTDDEDTEQVHENERAAAVFTGYVGKLPHVTKADSRTGCCQNKRESGRPESASPGTAVSCGVGLSHEFSSCAFGFRKLRIVSAPSLSAGAIGAGFCQHWPNDASVEMLFSCLRPAPGQGIRPGPAAETGCSPTARTQSPGRRAQAARGPHPGSRSTG